MTTPWPNARIATSSQSMAADNTLSSREIAACCRAQFLNEIGFFFLSLGFLFVSLIQGLDALGVTVGSELLQASFIVPVFSLWLLAQLAYMFLGGNENLDAVTKMYQEPTAILVSLKTLYICCIAILLVLFFAQSWLAKHLGIPQGSFWLLLTVIFAMSLVVEATRAFTWWGRWQAKRRKGTMSAV
jgi:hypothetical protein